MINKDTEEFEGYWGRLELQRIDLKKSLDEMNECSVVDGQLLDFVVVGRIYP